MTDAATTARRIARQPFAGVPSRDLARDAVAVVAILVGVALPWTASARGSDRIEVVLATLVALTAIVLPYACRAKLVSASWAADERRTRELGVVPLVIVALVHVVLDVVPSGTFGIGAGLGLGLAGAILAAEHAWPHLLITATGVLALGAVAAPILVAAGGGRSGWQIAAVALTALMALGVLWLTAGRFERGDEAAGLLLAGVGIAVALAAALLGSQTVTPWVESVHGTWFGVVLLPVLAAAAMPRLAGRAIATAKRPRLWSEVAVYALELVLVLSGYIALVALERLIDAGGSLPSAVRLIFGVLIAVVAYLARRGLRRDVASGYTTAVGAAIVIAALGTVLVIVRAGASTRTSPVDILLAFGLPAIVLTVLLVPRSLRALAAQDGAAEGSGARAPRTDDAPRINNAPQTDDAVTPVVPDGEASQAQTMVLAAVAPDSAGKDAVEPGTAEPAEPEAASPDTPDTPDTALTTAPSSNTRSTRVLPLVADIPGSKWSAAQAIDPETPLADLALIVQESPHLRPVVAANPSTYPALLDWLGALGDPEIDTALRNRE